LRLVWRKIFIMSILACPTASLAATYNYPGNNPPITYDNTDGPNTLNVNSGTMAATGAAAGTFIPQNDSISSAYETTINVNSGATLTYNGTNSNAITASVYYPGYSDATPGIPSVITVNAGGTLSVGASNSRALYMYNNGNAKQNPYFQFINKGTVTGNVQDAVTNTYVNYSFNGSSTINGNITSAGYQSGGTFTDLTIGTSIGDSITFNGSISGIKKINLGSFLIASFQGAVTGVTQGLTTQNGNNLFFTDNGSYSSSSNITVAANSCLILAANSNPIAVTVPITNNANGKISIGGPFTKPNSFTNNGKISVFGSGASIDSPLTSGQEFIVGQYATLNIPFSTNFTVTNTISGIPIFTVTVGTLNVGAAISDVNTSLSIANSTTLNINTSGSMAGTGTVNNSGTINLSGGALSMSGGITNSNTINSTTSSTSLGTITSNTGTINVNSGGLTFNTISSNSGTFNINSGGTANFAGSISSNTGTININGSGALSSGITSTGASTLQFGTSSSQTAAAANFTTAGAISGIPTVRLLTSGTTLNAQHSISNVNTLFSIASSTTANLTAGTFGGSGTVNNSGTININSGTLSMTGGTTNSGTINMSTNYTPNTITSNTGTINVNGGTLTLGSITANTGTINVNGSGAISGTLTGSNTASLNIGTSSTSGVTPVATSFTTGGGITIPIVTTNTNGTSVSVQNSISISNRLTVASGTTINIIASGSFTGAGTVNNSGTISISSGPFNMAGALTNSGTINIGNTYTPPSDMGNNTGIININSGGVASGNLFTAGGTININRATGAVTGTISGSGAAKLQIGTSTSAAPAAVSFTTSNSISNMPTINLLTSGTALTSNHNITGVNTIFSLASGTSATINQQLAGTGYIDNYGTLTFASGSTFSSFSNVQMQSNSTLNLNNTATLPCTITGVNTTGNTVNIGVSSGVTITTNKTISNLNILELKGTSGNKLTTSSLITNINNLNVLSPATLELQSDGSITNSGTLAVNGTLTMLGGSSMSSLSAVNINADTSTVAGPISSITNLSVALGATLQLSNGGSISNSGTLAVNGTFNMLNGSSMSNLSTININAGTSSVAGPITGVTNFNVLTSSTLNLASTGSIKNGTTLNINNATLDADGQIANLTNITIQGGGTLTTSSSISNISNLSIASAVNTKLVLEAGATVSNIGNFAINRTFQINSGASFSIDANSNITSSGGTGVIDNSGQLSLNGSNFNFDGSFTNKNLGTFLIQGTPTLNFTGSTFQNFGRIIANFNTSNSLPLITTSAETPDLASGSITIGYNNNFIATGNYNFMRAPNATQPIIVGPAILPQPSTYINSFTLTSQYPASGGGATVFITVDRNGFDNHALNPTAQSIGAYLEYVGANNPTQAQLNLLNALEKITNDVELTAALDSLLPPQYTMLVTMQNLDTMIGAIDVRLASLEHGYSSGDSDIDKNSVWVRAFSSNADQDAKDTLRAFNDTNHGYILGIDRIVNTNLTLGLAGSIAKTKVNDTLVPSTTTNISTYMATFYSSLKTSRDVYVDTLLAGGVSNYHGIRTISLPGYTQDAFAEYTTQQLTVKMMVSKEISIADLWQLTPRAMAQYTFIRQNSYTESGGSGFNTSNNPDNSNLFRLGAGSKLSLPFVAKNILSIPGVYFMAYVDAQGGYDTTNTQFISGGPIITNTVNLSKLMLTYGASYELKISNKLELVFNYDHIYRRGYQGNEMFINLRYIF